MCSGVVTIAQNSGLAIGNILGKALGSEVVNLMPDTTTISGLISTRTACKSNINHWANFNRHSHSTR
jgi:hypothetical protein